MKICTKCNQGKPSESFYFKGRKADNKRMSECSTCFNERNMLRYEEKANWLITQKGGGCFLCGYSACPAALEFHHTDPSSKDFQINKRWSMSRENLLKEIEKCVLLCSNCHRQVHWNLARGIPTNLEL